MVAFNRVKGLRHRVDKLKVESSKQESKKLKERSDEERGKRNKPSFDRACPELVEGLRMTMNRIDQIDRTDHYGWVGEILTSPFGQWATKVAPTHSKEEADRHSCLLQKSDGNKVCHWLKLLSIMIPTCRHSGAFYETINLD